MFSITGITHRPGVQRNRLLTQSVRKVALIPPNKVYIKTPTGNRKHAASLFIPVITTNRADPPTSRLTLVNIWKKRE